MKLLKYILLILLYSSYGLFGKKISQEKEMDTYDQTMFEWTRTWAEVIDLVKQKHYQIDHPEKGIKKAIDTFLNSLDPHSNFLDPDTYKSMIESTTGEFHGVGIVINNTRKAKDRFLTIVETIQDGPAEKAGIKQYDKIVEIDGKLLEGMTTEQATTLLKGARDSKVSLKIIREGANDILSFEVTRDVIKEQQSLCFYIKNKNIYYLSLSMFAENSAAQLTALLKKANQQKHKGLILDLRNNSGGLLSSAIDIAGLFLDKDSIVVSTRNKNQSTPKIYKTSKNPLANRSIPIVILINNYTASAAEILAGCLKVHAERNDAKSPLLVFLVGTTTFGKGSVQEVIPISQNSAIKLTTDLYFLPYDTIVQGEGISPDITIERSTPPSEQIAWLTENYGHENNLENYIKVKEKASVNEKNITQATDKTVKTKNDIEPDMRWQTRVKEMLKTDNQLKEAINVLSLISNAQKNLPTLIKNRTTALAYLQQNYLTENTVDIVEIKL